MLDIWARKTGKRKMPSFLSHQQGERERERERDCAALTSKRLVRNEGTKYVREAGKKYSFSKNLQLTCGAFNVHELT